MYYGGLGLKDTRQYRKHYSTDGTMEIKENRTTGAVEFVTYIGGDAYSSPIIYKKTYNSTGVAQTQIVYLHRDYQGSIIAITNELGAVVEKRLFDAWGNIAKVQDGLGNILNVLTILDRGYTGHEHLQSVGLIHMNGRLYDPKLHRFLQPDNYVQDSSNTQNYNRYGYCINNPLKYVDINGENFWKSLASIVVSVAFSAVGIAVGIATGGAIGWVGYVDFNSGNWQVYAGGWGTIGTTPAGGIINFGQTDGKFSFYGGFTAAPSFLNGSNKPKNGISEGYSSEIKETIHSLVQEPEDNTDLNSFAKDKFGVDYKAEYGVKSLKWASEMYVGEVPGYYYNYVTNAMYGSQGRVGAITTSDGKIYLSDSNRTRGALNLELVMGHEFIHSYHAMIYGPSYNLSASEYAAYEYSINFARANGLNTDFYIRAQTIYTEGPSNYDYRKIRGFENR
jgi:RHS repeat-associated protein